MKPAQLATAQYFSPTFSFSCDKFLFILQIKWLHWITTMGGKNEEKCLLQAERVVEPWLIHHKIVFSLASSLVSLVLSRYFAVAAWWWTFAAFSPFRQTHKWMRVVNSPNKWCSIWPRFWFLSTQYIILRATQSDTPCFSVPSSCWWWWWWHFLRNGRPQLLNVFPDDAPPPYSALNRWWLEWEAGAAHEQKCPYPLNTIQYNSIQLNTTQYNSIQLIKLFWHLPLTIFAAPPYQPSSHFLFSRQSMDTKKTEEKQ